MEYQVGIPWMFEGKIFRAETGMPILKIARKMVLLAVALPDPLTVAKVIEKSFILGSIAIFNPLFIFPLINKFHMFTQQMVRFLVFAFHAQV